MKKYLNYYVIVKMLSERRMDVLLNSIITNYNNNVVMNPTTRKYELMPTIWDGIAKDHPVWEKTRHAYQFISYATSVCDHFVFKSLMPTIEENYIDVEEKMYIHIVIQKYYDGNQLIKIP